MQFDVLQAFGATYMPRTTARLEHYKGERPIFDLPASRREIERARCRAGSTWKSGGYLIFDQTEALTTVDAEHRRFVGARNFDDTIFKTNLEAAGAIARQLRLRNLGGIIIADFIDMARDDHQQAVLAEFRSSARATASRTTVSGLHAAGLVEMTRKRTRESPAHMLCEPRPTCQGRGEGGGRPRAQRVLRHPARDPRARRASSTLANSASSPAPPWWRCCSTRKAHLAGLSEFVGKPISPGRSSRR